MMNFKKSAGIILMLVAIFASSCNKNSDNFKPIDVFHPEVIKIARVTQLSLDMDALRASITSTQTNLASLLDNSTATALKNGLTGISARIDGISSTLYILANQNEPSKAVIDGLKNELITLAAKVATNNDDLKARINVLGASDRINSAQLNALVKTNAALVDQINNAQKSLINLITPSNGAAIMVAVDVLIVQMNAAKVSFEILLAIYLP
jgi:hypothetical protein